MVHLKDDLDKAVEELVSKKSKKYSQLDNLKNAILTSGYDFEHIITFLDGSTSAPHRDFADELRTKFCETLMARFRTVETQIRSKPTSLYLALLDMHDALADEESVVGYLTLNYDTYFEDAVQRAKRVDVDYGIRVEGTEVTQDSPLLIKLHGSFNWKRTLPVRKGKSKDPLWIPPGIQKAKDRYPFSLLWARAREILSCDVLRIIGCRLSANDWDLISLLFATQYDRMSESPYSIEIIGSPKQADDLEQQFPYLNVRSILQIPDVGPQFIGEILGSEPVTFDSLDSKERARVIELAGSGQNWFLIWLRLRAEARNRDGGIVKTRLGYWNSIMEGP